MLTTYIYLYDTIFMTATFDTCKILTDLNTARSSSYRDMQIVGWEQTTRTPLELL